MTDDYVPQVGDKVRRSHWPKNYVATVLFVTDKSVLCTDGGCDFIVSRADAARHMLAVAP